ncbi:acyltransferase family protein [Paraburkholderia tropica]|uniref:acyltransferase family protein n=1 Tax=Paraburkholderia tropica TaxID=92647 RepID=UPI002AB15415|nr:acyltransferase [Paraburkholderia tropica]
MAGNAACRDKYDEMKGYQRLPSLTAGRGIAALLVAIHHACLVWGGILTQVGNVGWLGVAYFYILSGFVLAWSWSPQRSTAEFYVHRIARIYPMHIITLAVSLTAFWLLRNPLAGYVGTPLGTVAQLFLVHDWLPGHPNVRQAWNGVSWSLSAEFGFYLCAPALLKWSAKATNATLLNVGAVLYVLTSALGILCATLHWDRIYDFMQYNPVARLPEFVYGIIAARMLQRGVEIRAGFMLKLATFVPIALYLVGNDHRSAVAMVSLCVPAFLMFIASGAASDIEGKTSMLANGVLQLIGEASFSLYMTHALLLGVMAGAVHALHVRTHAVVLIAVFLVASVFVSIVSYKLIELPLRKLILTRVRFDRARETDRAVSEQARHG